MCDGCITRDEEIRWLKRTLYGQEIAIPAELDLTLAQTIMLRCLLARDGTIAYGTLFSATREIPGSKWDEPKDDKVLAVHMCRIRKQLRPFGLEIRTDWGLGYRLTPESRARLLNWNSETARAA